MVYKILRNTTRKITKCPGAERPAQDLVLQSLLSLQREKTQLNKASQ